MDDLISVIVPVYNVEDNLVKSLSSLLIQTYRKLQVIIIDDGSTDNSGEICDYYGANDGRIEVYHIQNAGVSNARNQGLNYAKGKYIYFFDPDDSLEPDALWTLYKQIKNGADLVECSYFKDFTNVKEEVIHPEKKISRLLDWAEEARDVADPWYTGNFEKTYEDIAKGCRAVLEKLS